MFTSHLKGSGAKEPMDNSQLPYSHFDLKSFKTKLKLGNVCHWHFIILIYYRKTQHKYFFLMFSKITDRQVHIGRTSSIYYMYFHQLKKKSLKGRCLISSRPTI